MDTLQLVILKLAPVCLVNIIQLVTDVINVPLVTMVMLQLEQLMTVDLVLVLWLFHLTSTFPYLSVLSYRPINFMCYLAILQAWCQVLHCYYSVTLIICKGFHRLVILMLMANLHVMPVHQNTQVVTVRGMQSFYAF